ncbi:heme ABC transporter ATP-binding protein [Mesorhizobium sp. NBSH29]|uniref:heme ABC transporter ATP-binding protein n=1 Tax=Mesorhizobium sp. NBSH29 TaxID=2654249 RepID=UPI0018968A9E|nr:heme ABC transporter ATP-binding protein [Mesorhizobium sp. NBSH29]QPC85839.1 heme ABC transporter ATP-binding protein [Mesorhizobium sp. NBSH29]
MISAHNLSVSLGGRAIIQGVDFAACAGSLTAIVGPNGSGKTTLLKALSGDLSYTGSVILAGQELGQMTAGAAARRRAVLPQQAVLAFPFTVREVVRLGMLAGFSGARPGEVDTLPERALARVDLAGFSNRFYQELSGGEQQRVQLARVLCQVWAPVLDGQPRALLLDEPVSSLDIRHQLTVMDVARDFARAGGAVVAVLHDLNLTAMYADHLHVMHGGRVAASGRVEDVLDDELMERVFGCRLKVGHVPLGNVPFVLPQSVLDQRSAA